jgi:alanine dehydrogenase
MSSPKLQSGLKELASQTSLYPQEKMLEVKAGRKELLIGIPKEMSDYENRLVLTPEATSILVRNGHRVCVETGAGDMAKFTDQEYSDAGALIVYSAKEAFEADIVLKVEPPTLERSRT